MIHLTGKIRKIDKGISVTPGPFVSYTQVIIAEVMINGSIREAYVEILGNKFKVGDDIKLKFNGHEFKPLDNGVAIDRVLTMMFIIISLSGFLFGLILIVSGMLS